MDISYTTLRAACRVLDVQGGYIGAFGETQQAYYNGLRDMLDIIVSAHYIDNNGYVYNTDDGHHVMLGGAPVC